MADEAVTNGTNVIRGRDGWLFFVPELRHLGAGPFWGEAAARVSRAAKPEHADPIPAILAFKEQLDKKGVELLLAPVPPKAVIYADMLDENSWSRIDVNHQQFYDLLRSKGINVLDLTDSFLAWRKQGSDALFCRQDTHWSGAACVQTARLLAKIVESKPWARNLKSDQYDAETRNVQITGDLWRFLGDAKLEKETLPLRFVGRRAGERLEPVAHDPNSPVILLGDSHNLVFHDGGDMHARGAGLPDQLAYELGFAVDLIAVRGSGATPARINLLRRAQSSPNFWSSKKLVIWCFSAREFTESDGWRIVPVQPAP